MAAHDLFEWSARVVALLPAGAGTVTYTGTTPATYRVRITWNEQGSDTPAEHQVDIRVPGL